MVAILFWHGDIILDAAAHWHVEGMYNAKSKVTIGDVINNDAEGGKIVDFAHVLVVLGELLMQRINRFDATRNLEFNFFATKGFGCLFLDFLHSFFGGNIVFFNDVGELVIALRVHIGKSDVGHLDTETSHVKTVGKRGENFERFFGDFLLFVWRKGGESAEIMKTIGEFNDEDANIRASGNEQTKKVVFGRREIGVNVAHAGTGITELGNTVN